MAANNSKPAANGAPAKGPGQAMDVLRTREDVAGRGGGPPCQGAVTSRAVREFVVDWFPIGAHICSGR